MKTNAYFERVACIVDQKINWDNVSKRLGKGGVIAERIDLIDHRQLVTPRQNGMFTREELAELLTFSRIISAAARDRIDRILILRWPIKLRADFSDWEEQVIDGLHHTFWDIILLGGSNFQFNKLDEVYRSMAGKAVKRVVAAEGLFAIGVNHTFYPHFLDSVSVPNMPLKEYIGRSFLRFDILASNPPIILHASK